MTARDTRLCHPAFVAARARAGIQEMPRSDFQVRSNAGIRPSRAKPLQLPAHLGLTPRVHQSGEVNRSGRISKSGDKLLRYHLVNAASSMLLISRKWCSIKA
ncbi:transposase [Roseibium sp. SCP14]|uniref:transposase n=1 Tax=Roseibium sp. SCP14 TaxID=3141375 RepID=UPI00333A6297